MRFLHTADWHLGRSLHGASLVEDQAHLLEQFLALAADEKPDAILLAGDVYDRAVPSADAIALLDDVLERLVMGLSLPVIVIAGNHDSPERLAFGSRILRQRGLHILGQASPDIEPVTLADAHGPVDVLPIPFADPAYVRHVLARPELQGHHDAMTALLEALRPAPRPGRRTVAVAHCFVTGALESESERPLSVGGAGAIDVGAFAGFDYVALGHLHRPQAFADGAVRYSGSLMRYSFGETDHDKAVLVVDLDAAGRADVRAVSLTPRRQVRCISGMLADLLSTAADDAARDDYLLVRLDDEGPIFDVMGTLREVWPNVLHVERSVLNSVGEGGAERIDHRKMGDLELFEAFFAQATGGELNDEHRAAFAAAAQAVRGQGPEGAP